LKKITLLIVLILCVSVAAYLYIDTKDPVISWGVEQNAYINDALKINISDDIGLKDVCYSLSGGSCSGEERCSSDLGSQSFDLLIDPGQCVVDSEPLKVKMAVKVVDTSIVANKTEDSIELTYDRQAPNLTTLGGTLSMKRGGTGVVLYEVGEVPVETGVLLDDLHFTAFALGQNKYLSFYAHPYFVEADDFKPRVFAVDAAGNLRKIRPGSRTASWTYPTEEIELTDDFLEVVKDKMMATSTGKPLDVFVEINNKIRQENYQKIVQLCQTTVPEKLWQGVFLRNQGATRANFAEDRTYKYHSEVVSKQVHTGLDIAGLNNMEIQSANHGKVIFVGEIGIYGNVVIIDHGYGLHTLYGHLSKADVREGDHVKKGDVIAVSGETGLAFGDHLHFEVRVNGVPVNPIEWFDPVWVVNNIETFLPKADM